MSRPARNAPKQGGSKKTRTADYWAGYNQAGGYKFYFSLKPAYRRFEIHPRCNLKGDRATQFLAGWYARKKELINSA